MAECPHKRSSVVNKTISTELFSCRQVGYFESNAQAFSQVASWVDGYLARPHKDLGRPGTVCPFAPEALMRDLIRIAVVRLGKNQKQQIEEAVLHFRRAFHEMEPRTGDASIYKAILIAFPDVSLADAPGLIDVSKERLKPLFVNDGLMLGEFHELNESPGLHNPDFRPLRSPIPLLAIRRMVYSDIVFLNRPSDPPERRIRFLEAYLNPANTLRKQDREAALEMLSELKKTVASEIARDA
jgi:hypothetical protein